MLKIHYSPLILRRVREMHDEIVAERDLVADRDRLCQQRHGLSWRYLRDVLRGTHKSPSARVLNNLGLEVRIHDPRTKQDELANLDQPCDWNPVNPRMRATTGSSSEN